MPQLESDHDIAYVPKKVCDRRQASLEEEALCAGAPDGEPSSASRVSGCSSCSSCLALRERRSLMMCTPGWPAEEASSATRTPTPMGGGECGERCEGSRPSSAQRLVQTEGNHDGNSHLEGQREVASGRTLHVLGEDNLEGADARGNEEEAARAIEDVGEGRADASEHDTPVLLRIISDGHCSGLPADSEALELPMMNQPRLFEEGVTWGHDLG